MHRSFNEVTTTWTQTERDFISSIFFILTCNLKGCKADFMSQTNLEIWVEENNVCRANSSSLFCCFYLLFPTLAVIVIVFLGDLMTPRRPHVRIITLHNQPATNSSKSCNHHLYSGKCLIYVWQTLQCLWLPAKSQFYQYTKMTVIQPILKCYNNGRPNSMLLTTFLKWHQIPKTAMFWSSYFWKKSLLYGSQCTHRQRYSSC